MAALARDAGGRPGAGHAARAAARADAGAQVHEALAIQKRTGHKLEDLGGIDLTIGVVWAYSNRNGQKTSWTAVEQMTFRELTGFFAAEPDDVDQDDPDSDAGKDG